MEHRVTSLETRLDTILPTLATKADLAGLGSKLHEAITGQVKWIVGTALILGGLALTIMTFVLNNAIPKPAVLLSAPAAAPIVIQVPYPQATGAPPQAPSAKR